MFACSTVTYDFPFFLFWLCHHASGSASALLPLPLSRSRIVGQWHSEKAHHPPWWFPKSCIVLGFVSSRAFPTLLPKCGLGRVALTRFQPNPKKQKNKKNHCCLHQFVNTCTFFFFFVGLAYFCKVCKMIERQSQLVFSYMHTFCFRPNPFL